MLGSQNNTTDETNDAKNGISCYKEAVQFSVSFVSLSVFDENYCGTAMNLVFLSSE